MQRVDNQLVTFLLPVNSTKYLSETICSILNIPNFAKIARVLIVADRVGLNEVHAHIPQNFPKSNFTIIESRHSGIVSALNLGLTMIDTKYVARIDQDDVRVPNSLALQVGLLESNTELLAVGGQIELIDDKSNSIGYAYYPTHKWEIELTKYMTSPLAHPATVFRRENVIAIGGYREQLPEDWDLWLRLSENGRITNINSVVIKYRIHDTQLSRSNLYKSSNAQQLIYKSLIERKKKNRGERELTVSSQQISDLIWNTQILRLRTLMRLKPIWISYRRIRSLIMEKYGKNHVH